MAGSAQSGAERVQCVPPRIVPVNVNKRYIPRLRQLQYLSPYHSGKRRFLEKWFGAFFRARQCVSEPRDNEALPNGVLARCRDLLFAELGFRVRSACVTNPWSALGSKGS